MLTEVCHLWKLSAPMHVVIVDPSRVVQGKISAELEATGCFVDCFAASDIALHYVKSTPSVDVVITSLELDPISGLELCWMMRTYAGEQRPLHIIVMSSNTSERALSEALDSGADDFMLKPVGRDELKARLRAADRIMTLQRQLIEQVRTDPLTGLLNRRAFLEVMAERRAALDATEFMSLCLVDIDNFKRVNDDYGYDVGDVVIKAVGQFASEEAPIVARLGGEEFALAFPVLDAEEAARWCDVIRKNIASHVFESSKGPVHVTCSLGVSEWQANETLAEAMKRADAAHLEAKTNGGNQTRVRMPVVALEPA